MTADLAFDEEWLPVAGFPNYEVSSYGLVMNAKTGKVLKQQKNDNGYMVIDLCRDGVRYPNKVHRLVARAFLPQPEAFLDVNHIDGDKTYNHIDNLEWATRTENMKHALDNGLYEPGRKPVIILETGQTFDSVANCARALGKAHESVRQAIVIPGRRCGGYQIRYLEEVERDSET